jgi:hypothetical protein
MLFLLLAGAAATDTTPCYYFWHCCSCVASIAAKLALLQGL